MQLDWSGTDVSGYYMYQHKVLVLGKLAQCAL